MHWVLEGAYLGQTMGGNQITLNHIGKEVLIKLVIIAIPTYAMSGFNLPKMWCSEINARIADFFVGKIGCMKEKTL